MQTESTSPVQPSPAPSRGMLVAGVFVVGVGAIVAGGLLTRHSQADQLKESAVARSVPTVSLVAWKDAPTAPLSLPARIEAWSRAPIYARVSGYLGAWNVDIGAPVKAGQVLATIETPDLDQDLRQAQAQLAVARSDLALSESTAKRWQSLVGQNAVSQQEADEKQGAFVSKKATAQALQASVDREQALKRYTRLVAPFDGVVTARNTDVGALVNAGSSAAGAELFVVSDLRKLRVYVQVPQRQVALIKPGSVAVLTVPERAGKEFKATVQSLSQAINTGTGAMLVQLAVDNAGGELLPGAYANVRFDLAAEVGGLVVPPGAVILGKNGPQVATVDGNGRVALKKVAIARDLGSVVQIDGVSRSDRIIDSPPDGIATGDAVRVAQAAPAPVAAPKAG
jgi:RND family efflux transporter MFP subunit